VERYREVENLTAVIGKSEIAIRGGPEALLGGKEGAEEGEAAVEMGGVELREEMRGGEVVHFPEAAHDGWDARLETTGGKAQGLIRQVSVFDSS
jgi:hypothetical protein